jgi:hypothetical protein
MAEIFHVSLETGDLSEFTFTQTDGGDLSVTTAAALVGRYGMQALVDDTNPLYGEMNYTQIATGVYGWRFYTDPNGITMANNDTFYLCRITKQETSGRADVQLTYDSVNAYEIFARIREDDGTYRITSNYIITDAPHYIECLVEYAASAISNDGVFELWIDGVQKETFTDLDLFTRSQPDEAFLGIQSGLDVGTSGTIYFDDFILRDDDTVIGAAPRFWAKPSPRKHPSRNLLLRL